MKEPFASHVAAADNRVLMSPELEERIDMSPYRATPTSSRSIDVTFTFHADERDPAPPISGTLVRCDSGMPHPTISCCITIVQFEAASSTALKLLSVINRLRTVTLSDGNTETSIRFHCHNITWPAVAIEWIKDSQNVLVTVSAW